MQALLLQSLQPIQAVTRNNLASDSVALSAARINKAPPVGLEPTIFGLEVRRLVH